MSPFPKMERDRICTQDVQVEQYMLLTYAIMYYVQVGAYICMCIRKRGWARGKLMFICMCGCLVYTCESASTNVDCHMAVLWEHVDATLTFLLNCGLRLWLSAVWCAMHACSKITAIKFHIMLEWLLTFCVVWKWLIRLYFDAWGLFIVWALLGSSVVWRPDGWVYLQTVWDSVGT